MQRSAPDQPLIETADDDCFLTGGGELGRMMRDHDWSLSPLGVPQSWPQSFRSVVGLLLNSKFPMFVAWGDDLTFLYNDAYAQILGTKHPQALGARFYDIWSEIWPDILPLVEGAMRGEASYRENLPLLMDRNGFWEQTWFTFSYSPVRDESGRVAGMFCAVVETTAQMLAARRRDALLDLDEKIQDRASPGDLSFKASEVLGQALAASRVGYGLIDRESRAITVERSWNKPGLSEARGRYSFADYGTYVDELLAGKPVANADVCTDPRTKEQFEAFGKLGICAHLDVPVFEDGVTVAIMFVHSEAPREWSNEEIAFATDFARRAHAAIARRTVEEEHRESDSRFRAVFNSEIIGLTIFDSVTGETETINDAFLRMTGYSREDFEQGRWDWRDITIPDYLHLDEAAIAQARVRGWWDPYEKYYRIRDGRVFPVRISSAPLPGYPGKVIVSIEDISDRKRWEEHQRLLVGELNHRVKNTLAIVQSLAHQTFPKSDQLKPYLNSYEQRLSTLAATHNLLTKANWASADLQTLLTDTLSLHSDGLKHIRLNGQPLALTPQAAVNIGLAVHELATNALKYGALSSEGGSVDVEWNVDSSGFCLNWHERGGPAVELPKHRGFGSRMIERALAHALDGETTLHFEPSGLRCEIRAPRAILSDDQPRPSPAASRPAILG